ncbi:ester cyclase [Yinghuangia seranimata]|uniref:ester cyclase n=1 Tax=Yinghuangia seranimata TaxID=408067 RepID=UPI00248A9B33|nr:ester cyclase [Yinghuangia seranimata]MDI2129163.1 ester cyclase [Yinghuangia seranimata]
MTFVQLIDCKTEHLDDMNRLLDNWLDQTQGRRTATHAIVGSDRSDKAHVVEIVEFPSYEEAMRNSALPETDRIFREMVALCEEPPTFTDLDIVRDDQLNKALCREMFDCVTRGDLDGMERLFAEDYHDHDPINATDTIGAKAIREECAGWMAAFDFAFTIDRQLADGDEVATRWTWTGTHTGDFMGMPATGRTVTMSGCTTFRIEDGRIKEGWWDWDALGMMRQLSATPG